MLNHFSSPIKEIFIILDDERTTEDPEHYTYLLNYIPEEILNSDKTVFIKTPNEFWSLWEQYKKGKLKITGISFDNDLGIDTSAQEKNLAQKTTYYLESKESNVTSKNVCFRESNVNSENVYFQEGSSILRELLWFRNEIEAVKNMTILVHTGNNQARRTFDSLLQSLHKV